MTPDPTTTNEYSGLNWAGNYRYAASKLYIPKDVGEIRSLIKDCDRVKVVGSRHSFNDIADSPASQISTEDLNSDISIDADAMTATVESGLRYGHFCSFLHDSGFALHNLASLPHISVAGACATATHGSGVKNGNLATAVEALEFVDGTGEVVTLEKQDEAFAGAVVNLGMLGVVTRLKLRIERTFIVTQQVFLGLPLAEATADLEAIMSSGYSVSLFTTFRTRGSIDQVWIKRRTDTPYQPLAGTFYGASAATENVHPIRDMSAENCTEQLEIPGAWYDRLPHFRMGYTPSSGAELQSEYFVSRANAADALLAVESLAESIRPYIFTSEIRAIAQDELWLSPSYKRDSVAFHFTWKEHHAVTKKILPMLERELAPFDARPHWGKLSSIPPAKVRGMYERFADFVNLVERFDPEGKFRNEFWDRLSKT